jgi:hypothetical protein
MSNWRGTQWQQETRLVSEHCSACVLCLWRADRSFEDHVLLLGDVAAFMNGMGYRVEHQVGGAPVACFLFSVYTTNRLLLERLVGPWS